MTSTEITILFRLFKGKRFVYANEKDLQNQIEQLFIEHQIAYKREYVLSKKDIPDFFLEGCVVEVKTKGSKREIYQQCLRYAEHDSVTSVLLVTARNMGNPSALNGKAFEIFNLNNSWL